LELPIQLVDQLLELVSELQHHLVDQQLVLVLVQQQLNKLLLKL
jgi:uncharacterized coiled-coil protein SlyX